MRLALPRRQTGAIMIGALMIFALVTTLSIGLAVSHERSQLRAESRFHGNQAREYLLGGEELARFALDSDYEEDQEAGIMVDTLDEVWAAPISFPLDEGGIMGNIVDGQALFNVNRLATSVQNSDQSFASSNPARFTEDQRRFIRLLQLLDIGEDQAISQQQAIEITEAVVDWIDPDDTEFGFGGAEALFYQRFDPPIRPANAELKSVTELRLVKGMLPEIFQQLQPFIVALPADAPLNVNTASQQLLRILNEETSLSPLAEVDAESMVFDRGGTGYEEVADFLAGTVPSSSGNNWDASGISVNSEYFILTSTVEVGRQRRTLLSLLNRDNGETRVVRHADFIL